MQLKKRHLSSLLFSSFLALSLWSCQDDNFDMEKDGDEGGKAFFSVSLVFSDNASPGRTRANEFDGEENVNDEYFFNNGVEEESLISTDSDANWIFGYDDSGNILLKVSLSAVRYDKEGSDNTGKMFRGACELSQNESELLPKVSSMRVVLNANQTLQTKIKGGERVENIALTQTSGSDNGYLFHKSDGKTHHTMSSSMTAGAGGSSPALEIEDGGLKSYRSMHEALENPCVTLYVERLQSKYTVLFHPGSQSAPDLYLDDNKVKAYDLSNQTTSDASNAVITFSPEKLSETVENQVFYVTEFDIEERVPEVTKTDWKIAIVGWGINGTEKSEYLYKNFGSNGTAFEDWNFTPNGYGYPIRNLWAVDPNYDSGAYPDQYRPAYDQIEHGTVNEYYDNEDSYQLNYLSFNQLINRNIRQYSAENTYDATRVFTNGILDLNNRMQFRCGNTLFLGAQLLINGFDDADIYTPTETDGNGLVTSGTKKVRTKYYMDNIFWSEEAYKNYFSKYLSFNLNSVNECVSDLTEDESFIPAEVFKPADGENKFYVLDGGTYRIADYRDFTIQPLYIVGGDGWCIPYPAIEGTNTSLYVKQEVKESGELKGYSYRRITKDEFEKMAYGFPTYFAKGYTEGRMYYAFPISIANTGANDFGLHTGEYGAVRNHWYHYRFTSLTTIGVPIHDPDQPIIPTKEPSTIGLGFEVHIIPWHVVEEDVNI